MNLCFSRILALLLGLGSAWELEKNVCTCTEEVKVVFAEDGKAVSVPCPKVSANEIKLHLLKNQEEMAFTMHNASTHHRVLQTGVEILSNDTATRFELTGETAREPGLYSCKAVITFPPPVKTYFTASRVIIVKGGEKAESRAAPDTAVWKLCVIALVLYSLVVTVVALVGMVKCKRAESSQGVYVNAPRRHNKGGGVMIPVAKYF